MKVEPEVKDSPDEQECLSVMHEMVKVVEVKWVERNLATQRRGGASC